MTQPLPSTYQELVWTDDMDPQAAETASDLESLEQDVLHIIGQVLNSNLDAPNLGVGAEGYLGSSLQQFSKMPSIIDAQLLTDARIRKSLTTMSGPDASDSYMVTVKIEVAGAVLTLNFQLGPTGLSLA